MKDRDRQLMFWGVTALAFALRAAQILLMTDPSVNPHWLRPVMDAGVHDEMARGILAGTWPPAEPFFKAPLYPYFLAGLYAVFGAAHRLPVQLVHAFVSALGAGLASLIAANLFGRRAGWMAGVLYAVAWTSIFFAGELLTVSLTVPLALLLLWLLLRGEGEEAAPPGLRGVLLAGLAWGLATVARANVLILAPGIVWYLHRHRGIAWRDARWAALAVGLALPILPVTAYNVLRGHDAVAVATSGGINFYIGNNHYADGSTVFVPGTTPTWKGVFEDVRRLAEEDEGRTLKPSAVDRHYVKEGLKFWAERPDEAIALQLKKIRLMLATFERSNNKNLYFWRERSPLLKWPLWPGWTVILVLAALGFARRDLRSGPRFLLLASCGLYALSIVIFFVNGRFRLPVEAMLTIPAAGGLELLWDGRRSRRFSVPRSAWLIAGALAAVSVVPDWITFHPRDSLGDPYIYYSLGNSYLANGDEERAKQAFRQALIQHKAHPDESFQWIEEPVNCTLGDLLVRQGRAGEALLLYSDWVRSNPRTLEGRVRLGDMLLQAGRHDEAAAQFEVVLRNDPDNAGAQIGNAWILYYNRDFGAALRRFEAAHRREPNAHALFGAGLCLIELGRLDEAERTFREVLVQDPDYWQAWGNLAGLYERLGRLDEARQAYRKVLSHNPQDQRARQWLQDHGG